MGSSSFRIAAWLACGSAAPAQIPSAAIVPVQEFRVTGNNAGWAWGQDAGGKFHLWRFDPNAMSEVSLPKELAAAGNGVNPEAFFISAAQGFLVWTQDRTWESKNGGPTVAVVTAKTEDSAASWHVESQTTQVTHPYGGVHEMQFLDSQNGYVILGIGAAAGQTPKTLLGTHDSGRSWQTLGKLPQPNWVLGESIVGDENAPVHLFFRSKNEGWVIRGLSHGQRAPNIFLFHTTDAGATWSQFDKFQEPSACGPECWLYDLSPLNFNPNNPREAFFSAAYYDLGPPKSLQVYRTHDTGSSWSGPEILRVPGNLTFADFSVGIAQGEGGEISLTRDSGHTWSANADLSDTIRRYKYARITEVQRTGSSLWVLVTDLDGSNYANAILCSNDDARHWSALSIR